MFAGIGGREQAPGIGYEATACSWLCPWQLGQHQLPRKGGKPHPTTRNPQRTFFTSNGTSRRRRCNASGLTTASSMKDATQ
jgi:hypothetical protein